MAGGDVSLPGPNGPNREVEQDPYLPVVFDHAMARRAGMTRHQITHRVRSGRWHRLRRGVFCTVGTWKEATPERRAALLGMAVVLLHTGDAPFALSHASAAAMHGLPVPAEGPAWITVAAGHGATTHVDRLLRQEVASLPPTDVSRLHDWPVTVPARTVVDCLRHLAPTASVAIADAALHRGLVNAEALASVLAWQASWPLAARARAALKLVDTRRESALESRSAVVMYRYGIPSPLCQVDVRDDAGRFLGRADFAWPEYGVIGEADGRAKYGPRPIDAFEAEKDRQAAIESRGFIVVRWGWHHLVGEPPPMITRLRSAFARSPRPRYRGSLAQAPLRYAD
jgi:hypothetical protein